MKFITKAFILGIASISGKLLDVLKGAGKSQVMGLALLLTFNIASAAIAPIADPIDLNESIIDSTSLDSAGAPLNGMKKRVTVTMTGYSSTPDQTDDTPFITATGDHVADGIVAANFLPFNTYVKIPKLFGDKIFIVKDRMNRRYSDRMDIWFPDRASALKFGLRKAEIVIL